jgi:branched-subunit amino acid ABC-type transport system permease component
VDVLTFATNLGDTVLFLMFSAVIAGGLGHPYGTMLGAVIVGIVTEVSAVFIGAEYKTDVALVVLILALVLRPQGLIPSKVRV